MAARRVTKRRRSRPIAFATANDAARVEPRRAGYFNAVQVFPYSPGALYQIYASPGQITDIALEPGEQLTGSGPLAAGDTVRWIVGDTESGNGDTRRVHIMVKPTRPAIETNLVVNTDRRTYLIELRSREKSYMPSVSWFYPEDRSSRSKALPPTPVIPEMDQRRYRYVIEGDSPPWRPVNAYDDGRKVYIEFSPGIGQGEMPPLFVIGQDGKPELVNYRVYRNVLIADRLFAAAELRLGGEKQQKVRNCQKRRETIMTGNGASESTDPVSGPRPSHGDSAQALRLGVERPRITRLSRKVLAGGTALALLLISGAVLWALRSNQPRNPAPDELYSTDHHNVADGLTTLPHDYAGISRDVPRLGPPLPGDLGHLTATADGQSVSSGLDAEQQRANQETEAARTSKVFASTTAPTTRRVPHLRKRPPTPRHRLTKLSLRTGRIANCCSSTPLLTGGPRRLTGFPVLRLRSSFRREA